MAFNHNRKKIIIKIKIVPESSEIEKAGSGSHGSN